VSIGKILNPPRECCSLEIDGKNGAPFELAISNESGGNNQYFSNNPPLTALDFSATQSDSFQAISHE
jgi:hypothetical protein